MPSADFGATAGADPGSDSGPTAGAVLPADVERWLAVLGLDPIERADRDGISSWDLVLDGRRRFDLRVTVILDPALALICWAHYAPPINDMFRKSYRRLLQWNDAFPFAKFNSQLIAFLTSQVCGRQPEISNCINNDGTALLLQLFVRRNTNIYTTILL